MLKKFLLAVVVIATVVSVSMAGCLSNISNPLGQSSKINDYANNFVTYEKAHSPGLAFTDVNIQQNGTDAVRLSYNTKSSSGGTTTSAVNIKQFANAADATAFYDGIAFGYMPVSDNSNATAAGNPYLLTFGHNAIRNEQTLKINSFAIVYASASIAWQQDEFVAWGDVSGIAGSTASTPTTSVTATHANAVSTATPSQATTTREATIISMRQSTRQASVGGLIQAGFTLITASGKPIAGATINVISGGNHLSTITTDANGDASWSGTATSSGNIYTSLMYNGDASYLSTSLGFYTYVTSQVTTPTTPIATPTDTPVA